MTLPLHRQLESQSGETDGDFGLEMVYRERLDKTINLRSSYAIASFGGHPTLWV